MKMSNNQEIDNGINMGITSVVSRQRKLEQLILLCFAFFPLTTLFQSVSIFGAINQLLIIFLVICLLLYSFISRIEKGTWIAILVMVANTAIDFAVTTPPYVNINMVAYLPIWCLMFTFFGYAKQYVGQSFKQIQNVVFAICLIWSLVVAVSAFFPSSYYVDTQWGSSRYFASITGNVFRLEPSAAADLAFLAVLVRIGKYDKKIIAALSLVPLYCALFGGSRTYLVVIAVLYIVFLRQLVVNKRNFRVVLCIVAAMFLLAASSTNIAVKISNGFTTSAWYASDPLFQLTSGRSAFWAIDMKEYLSMPLHQQLFGSGFNAIFDINLREYGSELWGHNDFVNLLITNGLVGVAVYLYFAIRCVSSYARDWNGSRWILMLLIVFVWLFNAFFNMAYTYVCASIALAVALTIFSIKNSNSWQYDESVSGKSIT
jgi:O-antigen ligase